MLRALRARVTRIVGFRPAMVDVAVDLFHSHHYLRHNARRLEHLASLGIDVAGKSVLEVGAGLGDHSHYYLDRGCAVTITEARPRSVAYLRKRYPNVTVLELDVERPIDVLGAPFDVVHCYGLLYHLESPETAIDFLARNCRGIVLLETCVAFGAESTITPVAEMREDPTSAVSGTGCRPTRAWVFERLKARFEHVYVPITQPNHEEFPVDWNSPEHANGLLNRAVFVASRSPLDNPQLVESLPARQRRHR